MEKVRIRVIVLTTLFAFVVISSIAQESSKKEAIKYVKSINFEDIPSVKLDEIRLENIRSEKLRLEKLGNIPSEKLCYIFPMATTLYSIDGVERGIIDEGIPTVIVSGNHQMIVGLEEKRGTSSIQRRSPTTIDFDFEAGKYYIIYFSPKTGKYNVELITDANTINLTQDAVKKYPAYIEVQKEKLEDYIKEQKEKLEKYQAFQQANPKLLEGMWKGETKRFYIQYTFASDRMIYEGKSKQGGMKPYVMEGDLFFNENTIVLIVEKVTINGEELKNFKTKYIFWYYTLMNNVLHLEDGDTVGSGLIWETNGEFQKY